VNLTESVVVAAITLSVSVSAYAALNHSGLIHRAEVTADRASCRSVDLAISAYVEQKGAPPTTVADLQPFVRGDIAKYRVVRGAVVGPGCESIQKR
jgi:hypothetical protein